MIVSLLNYKASVGKTTTALNLGAALVEQGRTVRLWDVDESQKDLTTLGRRMGMDAENPIGSALKASIEAAAADYHFIECPPRRELKSIIFSALDISDFLIVPIEVEFMMLRGMPDILSTIKEAQARNPKLEWKALVTQLLPRQKVHLNGFLKSKLPQFETVIRDSKWIADAPAYDKTVLQYAPRSAAARSFRNLAKELEAWQK